MAGAVVVCADRYTALKASTTVNVRTACSLVKREDDEEEEEEEEAEDADDSTGGSGAPLLAIFVHRDSRDLEIPWLDPCFRACRNLLERRTKTRRKKQEGIHGIHGIHGNAPLLHGTFEQQQWQQYQQEETGGRRSGPGRHGLNPPARPAV